MSDFEERLGDWMRTHPLRQPHGGDPADFTASVMARVRREPRPGVAGRGWMTWIPWHRLALGAVVAAACVAFVVVSDRPLPVVSVQPSTDMPVVAGVESPGQSDHGVGVDADERRALEVQAYVLASLDELGTDVVPLSEEDVVDELVELDQLAPAPDDEDDVEALVRELRVLDELGEG
jgi:hypothetical protein